MFKRILILVALSILNSGAAIIVPNSLSQADMQAAINSSVDGDYIDARGLVTSNNWTSPLIISNKMIAVHGAGIGLSIIGDGVTNASKLIHIIDNGNKPVRFTGFTIYQTDTNKPGDYAMIKPDSTVLSKSNLAFRIDNCKLINFERRGIRVDGDTRGLIDNCYFKKTNDTAAQAIGIFGDAYDIPPAQSAGTTYQQGPSFGTTNNVVIRNNVFDFLHDNDAAIEHYNGARSIINNNIFTNGIIGIHGNDSATRSGYQWDIYHNTNYVTAQSPNAALWMQIRGGTGYIRTNRNHILVSGYNWHGSNILYFDAYRATGTNIYSGLTVGFATGTNVIDNNLVATNSNLGVADGDGTHSGIDNQSLLTDVGQLWTINEWTNYTVWNTVSGARGRITANTATTVTATLVAGTGDSDWDTGDSYKITFGMNCLDCIGMVGPTTFGSFGSSQTVEPHYEIDNILTNHITGLSYDIQPAVDHIYPDIFPNAGHFILSGIHFFNNTLKPGYTPLGSFALETWGDIPSSGYISILGDRRTERGSHSGIGGL